MRVLAYLLLAASVAGIGCGSDSGTATCANPARTDARTCAAGEIWYESVDVSPYFNPFCGRVCGSTSDCPSGMTCVWDWTVGLAGAVCVSDVVPVPRCQQYQGSIDGPPKCADSQTLATPYVNDHTGIAGAELTHCPNGCEDLSADGGLGYSQARCR